MLPGCDHPGLDRRRSGGIHHDPPYFKVLPSQQIEKHFPGMIITHQTDEQGDASQRADIIRDVRSSTQANRFGFHINDRDGGFR
jgi:hypothetical protein